MGQGSAQLDPLQRSRCMEVPYSLMPWLAEPYRSSMVRSMTDTGEMTEDRGFKALFAAYPRETIEVFAPELLAERGQPLRIDILSQESTLPDLGEPSRFLDIALLASWADGSQVVITLIEHWSAARKVDLRRVLWYSADLALRHPAAAVLPVVLVTEPTTQPVPDRLVMTVAGVTTLALQVRVVQVTPADVPRLRALQNRVAAMLTALVVQDAVEDLVTLLAQMARSPGPVDDLERFLPFAAKLAKLRESDAPRFRRRLEETGMVNVITEMKNEARAKVLAEGVAQGVAQGHIAAICHSVSKGRMSLDAARAEVQDLLAADIITRIDADAVLAQWG